MNVHVPAAVTAPPMVRSNDRHLVALCRRGYCLIARDRELWDVYDRLGDVYMEQRPEGPRTICAGVEHIETSSSSMLREVMKKDGHTWSRAYREHHRYRIKTVQAHERACAKLAWSLGLSRAERAFDHANGRSRAAIEAVVELPALTADGVAAKAALLLAWVEADNQLENEGAALALSIAEDAKRLGSSGAALPKRSIIACAPAASIEAAAA